MGDWSHRYVSIMKKLLTIAGAALVISCTPKGYTTIHYSKKVSKCIENLETMERWLQEDYENGDIPHSVAQNYMYVIVNTKCGLKKKIKANDDDCTK